MSRFVLLFVLLFHGLNQPVLAQQRALFDSHSHYSAADSKNFTPQQIVSILDQNNIANILISGTPTSGTEALYSYAPERVIPFLSVYRNRFDKQFWMWDEGVIERVTESLKTGIYRGIGELHIFAKDKHSPVLKKLVHIAQTKNLVLMIHGDADVLDVVFGIAPNVDVIWAHLGTRPFPDFIRSVLKKYPNHLYIDTSVRDKQLLETQRVGNDWRALFTDYQDRFLVAIDTFSVNRWNTYGLVVTDINRWLNDLPPEVAEKLAYRNANKLLLVPSTAASD